MLLYRAAAFLNPEAVWQQLESQLPGSDPAGLTEFRVGSYGAAELFLGIVNATGERALWLRLPPAYRLPAVLLPEALWMKLVSYSDHALLTVVLTEPDFRATFAEFAHHLSGSLSDSGNPDAASLLLALLQEWQARFAATWRQAA